MPVIKAFQPNLTKLISNLLIASFILLGSTFVAMARDQIVIVGSWRAHFKPAT